MAHPNIAEEEDWNGWEFIAGFQWMQRLFAIICPLQGVKRSDNTYNW